MLLRPRSGRCILPGEGDAMNLFAVNDSIKRLSSIRGKAGFLDFEQLLGLEAKGTVVFDPFSILLSSRAAIGRKNVFYPQVVVETASGGKVEIGEGNVFWPGTVIRCLGGTLKIGDGSEFGPGGVTISAGPGETVEIGDRCRLQDGAKIQGENSLGTGSQVLGPLTLRGCVLGAGEDYRHADPDERGGVLKGSGFASKLTVERGEVINGRTELTQGMAERQRRYHPEAPGAAAPEGGKPS